MADPAVKLSRGRPRRDQALGLTQDKAVAAVIGLARSSSRADISMREVAETLNVSAKLLYTYTSSKDELLDLAARSILKDLTLPSADLAWDERFAQIMRAIRSLARD